MKNKLFSFILALVACVTTANAAVYNGSCGAEGDNVVWLLNTETGVLTISGNGAMADYNYNTYDAPWQPYKSYMTSVIINHGVTTIGTYAFQQCTSIKNVSIPNGVTVLGHGAFKNCSNLIHVTIPESVTRLTNGGTSFQHCNSMKSVIWNAISSVLEQHHSGSYYPPFHELSTITTFVFGEKVEVIPRALCYGLTGLTCIEIPSSVKEIGPIAFKNCSGLTTMFCYAVTPPALEENVFSGVDKSIPLYVPEKSVDAYKSADQWKDFANILPISGIEPKFTITWLDEEGNVLKTDEVEEGATPLYSGETPTKTATAEYTYEFAGWLPKIQPATKDICYTTFFERNKVETPKYLVNINGENCSLHISNEVPAGTTLQVEAVADECFQFQKWSDNETANPRTINVTEDANLTAEFNKLQYTITGKNDSQGGQVNIKKQ